MTTDRRKIIAAANAAASASERLSSALASGSDLCPALAKRLLASIVRLESACEVIEMANEAAGICEAIDRFKPCGPSSANDGLRAAAEAFGGL